MSTARPEGIPAELRGPHFRLCVRVAELAEPAVPSERRLCHLCLAPVWYDPKASIHPATEIVICEPCLMVFVEGR